LLLNGPINPAVHVRPGQQNIAAPHTSQRLPLTETHSSHLPLAHTPGPGLSGVHDTPLFVPSQLVRYCAHCGIVLQGLSTCVSSPPPRHKLIPASFLVPVVHAFELLLGTQHPPVVILLSVGVTGVTGVVFKSTNAGLTVAKIKYEHKAMTKPVREAPIQALASPIAVALPPATIHMTPPIIKTMAAKMPTMPMAYL